MFFSEFIYLSICDTQGILKQGSPDRAPLAQDCTGASYGSVDKHVAALKG